VFHRAFDLVPDHDAALAALVETGVTRVLTSGGAATAYEGRATLARLVAAAGERLTVLAGGGVGPEHAAELVRATGVRELHGSFRGPAPPAPDDPLGFALPESTHTLDADRLRATRHALLTGS
jgi:copper homeostasis protein